MPTLDEEAAADLRTLRSGQLNTQPQPAQLPAVSSSGPSLDQQAAADLKAFRAFQAPSAYSLGADGPITAQRPRVNTQAPTPNAPASNLAQSFSQGLPFWYQRYVAKPMAQAANAPAPGSSIPVDASPINSGHVDIRPGLASGLDPALAGTPTYEGIAGPNAFNPAIGETVRPHTPLENVGRMVGGVFAGKHQAANDQTVQMYRDLVAQGRAAPPAQFANSATARGQAKPVMEAADRFAASVVHPFASAPEQYPGVPADAYQSKPQPPPAGATPAELQDYQTRLADWQKTYHGLETQGAYNERYANDLAASETRISRQWDHFVDWYRQQNPRATPEQLQVAQNIADFRKVERTQAVAVKAGAMKDIFNQYVLLALLPGASKLAEAGLEQAGLRLGETAVGQAVNAFTAPVREKLAGSVFGSALQGFGKNVARRVLSRETAAHTLGAAGFGYPTGVGEAFVESGGKATPEELNRAGVENAKNFAVQAGALHIAGVPFAAAKETRAAMQPPEPGSPAGTGYDLLPVPGNRTITPDGQAAIDLKALREGKFAQPETTDPNAVQREWRPYATPRGQSTFEMIDARKRLARLQQQNPETPIRLRPVDENKPNGPQIIERAEATIPPEPEAAPAPAISNIQPDAVVRLHNFPEMGYLRVKSVDGNKVQLESIRDGKPVTAHAGALEVQQPPEGYQFQAPGTRTPPPSAPEHPTPELEQAQAHPDFGHQFMPEALQRHTAAIAEAHNSPHPETDERGSTYSVARGEQPASGYAVSVFPERTARVPGADITPEDLHAFVSDNADLLKDPRNVVGTWHDPKSNATYLDVTTVVPDRERAVALGRAHLGNQKGVYDLEKGEFIGTGGNGEDAPAVPPLADRTDWAHGLARHEFYVPGDRVTYKGDTFEVKGKAGARLKLANVADPAIEVTVPADRVQLHPDTLPKETSHEQAEPSSTVLDARATGAGAEGGEGNLHGERGSASARPAAPDTGPAGPEAGEPPAEPGGSARVKPPAPPKAPAGGVTVERPIETAPERNPGAVSTSRSVDPDATGLANQVQKRQGLAPEKGPTRTQAEIHAEGKRLVRAGEINPEELARDIAQKNRPFTDMEGGALLEGRRQLENAQNATAKALDTAISKKATPAEIQPLQEAYAKAKARHAEFLDNVQKGKTALSGGFRSLQLGTTLDEGNPAQVLAEARRAKGADLDSRTERELRDLSAKIEAHGRQIAAYEAELKRVQATEGARQVVRRTPRLDKAEILKEREAIHAELDELLKSTTSKLHDVGSVAYDAARLGYIGGKLVLNHLKAGAASLEEAVNNVIDDLKARGVEATADQLIDDVAHLTKGEPRTRDEIQARYQRLRGQAKSDANVRAQITELKRQLHEGDYSLPSPKAREVTQRLADLRAEREILTRQVRRAIEAERPKNAKEKVLGALETGSNLVRGTILGSDIGVLTRQGLFAWARPATALRATGHGIRAALSEADMVKHELAVRDRVINGKSAMVERSRAGLQMTDGSTNEHEELIVARLMKKVPVIGRFAGGLERFQQTFINTVRADLFDQGLQEGWTPQELKLRAEFINSSTGRSNIKNVPRLLRLIMTSPRYETSRWEMLARPFKDAGALGTDLAHGQGINRAAAANLRDMATTAVGVFSLYKLAELAGYQVNWNPQSSDFLKMRRGDDVWDPSAGVAIRLRDTLRLFAWTIHPSYNKDITRQIKDTAVRTISPAIRTPVEQGSMALQKARGEVPHSPFGGFTTPEEQQGFIGLTPLIVQGMQQALKEEGPGAAAWAGAREFVGQSANRYPRKDVR
jgi:hypothetical protein